MQEQRNQRRTHVNGLSEQLLYQHVHPLLDLDTIMLAGPIVTPLPHHSLPDALANNLTLQQRLNLGVN